MSSTSLDSRLGPILTCPPAQPPSYNITLTGKHVTLVPIQESHADALYPLLSSPENALLFDYLFDTAPTSLTSLRRSFATKASTTNPWTYTILLHRTGTTGAAAEPQPAGMLSLMRMDLAHLSIEVGSILYTRLLQRSPAATEAQYLLARYVFDTLGFQRYEWKCNARNAPSVRAARRLGFVYEGCFRRHMVVKGRSRDTMWFSVVAGGEGEGEWGRVKRGLEGWLAEENFDEEGVQRRRLEDVRGDL